MNPADQIEAIVARAVAGLRSIERRHGAEREAAADRWRDPVVDEDETTRNTEEDADDDRSRPILGPAAIAALSAAAGA